MSETQTTSIKLTQDGFRFLCRGNIAEADRILKDLLASGDREKIALAYDYYHGSGNKMLALACAGSLQHAKSLELSEEDWEVSRVLTLNRAVLTPDGFVVPGNLSLIGVHGPISLPICAAKSIRGYNASDITLPLLAYIDGGMDLERSSNLCFQALKRVRNGISALGSRNLELPELIDFEGSIHIERIHNFLAEKLSLVRGNVYAMDSTNAQFPELVEVSQLLDWRRSLGFMAPRLIRAEKVLNGRKPKEALPLFGRQDR